MSYPGYTPTPPPTTGSTPTQPPPNTPSYPYGAYSYHPQTPGAYSYAGAYQTGVTSYGWTYPYSYVPQHPQAAAASAVSAYTPRPPVTHTPTTTTTSMPQRAPTFSSYTPSYTRESVRESVPSLNVGGARGGRRQSNLKGLFTKECGFHLAFICLSFINWHEIDLMDRSKEFDVWLWRRPESSQRHCKCDGRDTDRVYHGRRTLFTFPFFLPF